MSELVFPVIDYVNKWLAKTLNPKDKQIDNIEDQTIYSQKQQFNDWLND